MNTPFFPAWRSRFAALGRRACRKSCAVEIENEFSRFLPHGLIDKGVGGRNRIYTTKRTFWAFLWQVLQPKTSCRAVVRKIQAEVETLQQTIDENTSAYCQARSRLPVALLLEALCKSAESADKMSSGAVPGWSRPIKVVDATSCTTPDTVKNREEYHYPSGQKKGCGFPVLRALAFFSLSGGAIHQVTTAPCYTSELQMFKALRHTLKTGDILMGDRVTGCYLMLASMPLQGVDVVARLNQGRNLDLRTAEKLGHNEWKTTLTKSSTVPKSMSKKEWAALPDTITVRIIRSKLEMKGFRTQAIWIVTTLIDPFVYPLKALVDLYLQRWQMELSFRDLKTTLGMESLRCLSPHMIEKEILLYLIAHNCLRALMGEAAATHKIARQRISFKGTMDTIRSFLPVMLRSRSVHQLKLLHKRVLKILADDSLPLRPGRREPRALKKRPKPYPRLTKPRHKFKEIPHKRNLQPRKRTQIILT